MFNLNTLKIQNLENGEKQMLLLTNNIRERRVESFFQ